MADPDESKGAAVEAHMRDASKVDNEKGGSGKLENETCDENAHDHSSPKRNVSEGANGIGEMHVNREGSGDHQVGEKIGTVADSILTDDGNDSSIVHNAPGVEENGTGGLEDVSAGRDDMDTDTTKDKLAAQAVESPTADKAVDGDNLHVENVGAFQMRAIDSVDSGGHDERGPESSDLQVRSETAKSGRRPVGMKPMDLSKQEKTKKSFNGNGSSSEMDTMERGSEYEGDEKARIDELTNSRNENDGDEKDEREKDGNENEKDVNDEDGSGDGGALKENGHESSTMDVEKLSDVGSKDGDKNDIGDEAADSNDDGEDDDDPFAGLEDIATMDLYEIGHYTFGKKDSMSRCKALSDMSGRTISESLRREYAQRGMRRSVRAVMLVHEHNFPHVLLLQRSDGKGEFMLPGGRLRPGESFEQGLERKLKSKLGRPDMSDEDGSDGCLEVGDKRKMNALKFFLGLLLCVID